MENVMGNMPKRLLFLWFIVIALCISLVQTGPVRAEETLLLEIANDNLVLEAGSVFAKLEIETNAASADWEIHDYGNAMVDNGTETAVGGRAEVDVSHLDPGYYTFSVSAALGAEQLVRTTSFAVLTALPAGSRDLRFGVQLHLHRDYVEEARIYDAALTGFGAFRNGVLWESVEKSWGYAFPPLQESKIRLAGSLGMKPLLTIAYRSIHHDDNLTPSTPEGHAAFAAYASKVLEHYGDVTNEIEVYNEFNHTFNDGLCGRTADCYLPLLIATHDKVKEDHPNAVVVGPATAGIDIAWLNRLIELGGLDDLDAVSAHRYTYPDPPEGRMDTSVASARAALDAADAASLPFWLTENGWPTALGGTTEDQQADYIIRSYVLAFANGAERYYYYDFLNDGTDPANNEHNFGLMRRAAEGVKASSPKPALVSMAAMIRQLEHKPYAGTDSIGAAAHSVRFGAAPNLTRVMWSEDGTSANVHVNATGTVTVTDRFGAEQQLHPVDGVVQLTIDEHPIFLSGPVTSVEEMTAPIFTVNFPEEQAVGETLNVTITTHGNADTKPYVTRVHVLDQSAVIQVHPKVTKSKTIAVAADFPVGEHGITAKITDIHNNPLSLVQGKIKAVPPTEAEVIPKVGGVDPISGVLDITVKNNRRNGSIQLDSVSAQVGSEVISVPAGNAIPAQSSHRLQIPVPQVIPGSLYEYRVTSFIAGQDPVVAEGRTSFNPLVWGESALWSIDLASQGTWVDVNGTRDQLSDLSGSITLEGSPDGLRILAEIEDDVHWQPQPVSSLWHGDSVQIAVSPGYPGDHPGRTEFALLFTPEGPLVYTQANIDLSAAGPMQGAVMNVQRTGTTTTYDALLPWSSLGLAGAPDTVFSMAVVINDNDNDGAGRAGYIEWASGIARNRSTEFFLPVTLLSE